MRIAMKKSKSYIFPFNIPNKVALTPINTALKMFWGHIGHDSDELLPSPMVKAEFDRIQISLFVGDIHPDVVKNIFVEYLNASPGLTNDGEYWQFHIFDCVWLVI